MKTTVTLLSGFLGILFFEGFARLIISFYHRIEFSFFGISHLPADIWMFVIFFSVLISTWLASMLIFTIMQSESKKYAFMLGLIILFWRAFEIYNSYHVEPAYYFTIVIGLHFSGIYLASIAYSKQKSIQ